MISFFSNYRDLSLSVVFQQQQFMLYHHSILLCSQHFSGSQYQISLQTVYSLQKLFLSLSPQTVMEICQEHDSERSIRPFQSIRLYFPGFYFQFSV